MGPQPSERSKRQLYYRSYRCPFGPLALVVDGSGRVVRIAFVDGSTEDTLSKLYPSASHQLSEDTERTAELARQLDEYFAGRRDVFDLPLEPDGSAFQRRVWRLLAAIPHGETRTYGELAQQLGRPGAARAVGRANATNPLPIVVPCHRVVGADGTLTGFAGGVEFKRRLLRLEGREFER